MRHQQSAFSIIELMVVLTVAGIILAIGVPSFNSQIKNSRLTGSVNDLVGAMHLSRSEASKRNTPVIMCTSSTSLDEGEDNRCTNTEWTEGWLVYADNNQNGTLEAGGVDEDSNPIGDNDTIIRRQGPQRKGVVIDSETDFDIKRSITYLPNGFADLPLNAQSDRFIVYCDELANDDRFSRVLALSNSGRPRILSRDRAESGAPSCE